MLLTGILVGGALRQSPSTTAGAAEPETGEQVTYTGGDLQPVTPARVLDTRSGIGAPAAPLGTGGVVSVKVTGVAGVPAIGVDSVVLNLTGIAPTGNTYLTVWPHGDERPVASSLNLDAREVRPNLVSVKVGRGGMVDIYNYNGDVDLAADVSGWFPVASGLRSVSPSRILDTRSGLGAPKGPLGPGRSLTLQVTGRGGVPSEGVSAVVVNLTGVSPTAGQTYLTAWPAGLERPVASNLNLTRGDVAANLAVVKVGSGGKIGLYNYSGNVNVVADVVGWFSSGSSYNALTPARILDTRKGIGSAAQPVGQNSTIELDVLGVGGVPSSDVGAVVLNVTGISPTGSSTYVTAWPKGVPRPVASNLNLPRGAVIANLVVVKVGSEGKVDLFNYFGKIHLAVDVVGWFPTGADSSTSMTPKSDTVLVGPGDITSLTPTGAGGTGGEATLAASADIPEVGGQFAFVGGPAGDAGASGEVASVTNNPDGTATVSFSDANLQDLFDDLEIHVTPEDSHPAEVRSEPAAKQQPLVGAPECTVGAGIPLTLPTISLGNFTGSADFSLRHRTARVEFGGALRMGWATSVTGAVSCSVDLAEGPIGWIGPVEIGWAVGAQVSISASVNASTQVTVPLNVGFSYEDGTATDLSHADVNGTAEASAAAELSAGFQAGVSTKLFGIVGVEASLSPGLSLSAEQQSDDSPDTCVTLSANIGVGLDAEVGKWGVGWSFNLASKTLAEKVVYTTPACIPMQWTGTITVDDSYSAQCVGENCSDLKSWGNKFQGDFDLLVGSPDGSGFESYLSRLDVTSIYSEHASMDLDNCTLETDYLSTTTFPGVDRVGLMMKKSGSDWLVMSSALDIEPVESAGESGAASVVGQKHLHGCGQDEIQDFPASYPRFPWLPGEFDNGWVLLPDSNPDPNRLVGSTDRTVIDPNQGPDYAGLEKITLTYDLTRVPIN